MKVIADLCTAMAIGEVDGVMLFVNRRGEFYLRWYVEEGSFWKFQEVSREDALAWCREKSLPEWDYRPLFGLWDEE